MKVLVTGGTGILGREVVRSLDGRAEVRVLSRKPAKSPGRVQGDLETGAGLAAALEGIDVVAHLATAADYRRPDRDVLQARNLIEAARSHRPHIVTVSIVGVDKIPFGYYRAKLAVESLVEQSGLPWTTLRATQFHELALTFLMLAAKPPVVMLPRGLQDQPVDVAEVGGRLAELVLAGPAGRVPDLGGPQVLDAADLARTLLELTHRRRPVVEVPAPGRVLAAFRAGHHLLSEGGVRGTRTFEDFLRARIRPDGTIARPYGAAQRG